ncbi:MAG: hypothetical protein JNL87_09585 [Burkholderiaceae bacterium]|nr:hypothetical protein [Burkholderiaceae bacterium]
MKTLLLPAATVLLVGCAGLPGHQSAEPNVQHIVAEDDKVRVEELRVRGQTQRITVNPKVEGAKSYEIHTRPGGSDPSKGREGVGQSLWQLFSF